MKFNKYPNDLNKEGGEAGVRLAFYRDINENLKV